MPMRSSSAGKHFRAVADVFRMFRQRGDRRDAEQVFQLIQEAVGILAGKFKRSRHDGLV